MEAEVCLCLLVKTKIDLFHAWKYAAIFESYGVHGPVEIVGLALLDSVQVHHSQVVGEVRSEIYVEAQGSVIYDGSRSAVVQHQGSSKVVGGVDAVMGRFLDPVKRLNVFARKILNNQG